MKIGTTSKERILAGNLRTTAMSLIQKYLDDTSEENDKFRKDLILKLATNILPRKTEIGGDDSGIPVQITFDESFKHRITSATEDDSQGQA